MHGRAGELEGWPARRKWRSLGWWAARHGARSVPVELGAGGAWREAVMPLRELVDRHLAPSARGEPGAGVAYLAQHALLDQVRAARVYPEPFVLCSARAARRGARSPAWCSTTCWTRCGPPGVVRDPCPAPTKGKPRAESCLPGAARAAGVLPCICTCCRHVQGRGKCDMLPHEGN